MSKQYGVNSTKPTRGLGGAIQLLLIPRSLQEGESRSNKCYGKVRDCSNVLLNRPKWFMPHSITCLNYCKTVLVFNVQLLHSLPVQQTVNLLI